MKKAQVAAGETDGLSERIAELQSPLDLDQPNTKNWAESENLLGQLINLLPDAVLVHRNGKIVVANAAAAKLFGAETTRQLIGKDTIELVHPDDRALMLSRRQEILDGKTLKPVEINGQRIDGSNFMFETLGSRIPWDVEPAILVVIRDITQRKRVEEALRESEERFRDLIEGSVLGTMIRKRTGERLYVNQAYLNLFGFDSVEEVLTHEKKVISAAPHETKRLQRYRDARIRGEYVPSVYEFDGQRKDGSIIRIQTFRRDLVWEHEEAVHSTYIDITDHEKAEQALRESEERYALAVAGTSDGIWDWKIQTDEDYFSPRWKEILGYADHELDPHLKTFTEALHPDDHDLTMQAIRDHLEKRVPYDSEFRLRRKQGDYIWVHAKGQAVWNKDGKPLRMAGSISDITERREADKALHDSEGRLRRTVLDAPIPIMIHAEDGEVLMVSNKWTELSGYSHADIPTILDWTEKAYGRNKEEMCELIRGLYEITEAFEGVANVTTAMGEQRTWEFRTAPLGRLSDGRRFITSMAVDVTERKQVEISLQKSEERYRRISELSPDGIIVHTDGIITFANTSSARILGAETPDKLIGMRAIDFVVPEQREEGLERRRKATAGQISGLAETRYLRLDGSETHVERVVAPITLRDKPSFLVIVRDINERKRAEVALRASEAQLRLVTDNIPVQVAYVDRDHIIRFVNQPYTEWHGISQDVVVGMHVRDVRGNEAFKKNLPYSTRTLAGEVTSNDGEGRLADGSLRYFRTTRVPHFADDQKVLGYFVIFVDLTEHREREAQLRQAQKMEAVGQLTGGVAHDFNNLLTIILGNLELLERKLEDREMSGMAQAAINASRRGAELTHRLLAFSRKQTLAPAVIELDQLVAGMTDLMRRTLGETIEIEVTRGDDLWRCEADPGQLESAILNLALNARDAMPQGGKLTIETSNVKLDDGDVAAQNDVSSGEYVLVSVSDTGTGMSRDVIDHAFEPFFTNKDVGAGSGLGLSMVHGFINQSGGFVTIDSTEGVGTTVKLHLPRTVGTCAPVRQSPKGKEFLSQGEKVLVVEDDPDVRALTVNMLADLGYNTVEAADGKQAIEVLQQTSGIELLFTDVGLPGGMSGVEVAREAIRQFPNIKLLFTSGYGDDVLARHGGIGADAELVHKPFRKEELAQKLRAVMGQSLN